MKPVPHYHHGHGGALNLPWWGDLIVLAVIVAVAIAVYRVTK